MVSLTKVERNERSWGKWIVLLAVLVFIGVAVILIGQPIRKAKRTEQALNDRFGEAPAYVPAADGAIHPDRMEAFLRVRERIFEHCRGFQERVGDLYQLDDPQQIEARPQAAPARGGVSGLKKLISFGPDFLRFMDSRNRALLEEEMGFGEYLYIYILAYLEPLRRIEHTRFAGVEQAYVGPRAKEELIQILRNQLKALVSGSGRSADPDLAARLQAQITDLSEGRQTFPWEDGLPPAIAASFEPYAMPLARFYCEGIAKIELMQKNKGFKIKN